LKKSKSVNRSSIKIFALLVLVFCSVAGFSKTPEKKWEDRVIESLSLRDRIAQLLQVRVQGKFLNRSSPEYQGIAQQVRRNHVGGVVLFAGNVYESAILLNELQTLSKLPLLVSADFERGVSFRIADTTSFPWSMALGATGSEDLAYQQGLITGQESRALGVHWIFAPVVDVNNNPDNPVINIRSFGEDPQLVARLGAAFIRGAKKSGVLTTAKHFPGHGDTAADSHLGLPVIGSDMARLDSMELIPFKSAIDAGVDSIMTAHLAVPQVTGDAALPATLSRGILTGLLREKLGFQGIVVTDALEMGGIANRYWAGLAAIRAIQAGADILLLPPDALVAINEVERAVRRGEIPESRINESVRKILRAKRGLGLNLSRIVDIRRIGQAVASPRSQALAAQIADRSITAVKDEAHLLPINPVQNRKLFSIVLASDLESSPGALFQSELRRRFPSIRTTWANARISDEQLPSIDKAASDSDEIICSTLARLTSGQDTIGLPESQKRIIEKLLGSGKPVVWVAFGNPYVVRLAPLAGTYLCTFSYSDSSQMAAARAISGEIPISGKMPVSIPLFAKAGAGLQIPKLDMTLKSVPPESASRYDEMREKVRRLLNSLIADKICSRAQLVAGCNGAIVLDLSSGAAAYGGSKKISPESGTNLGTLSELIGTASAAMLASGSGRIIPGAPVRDYIPELQNEGRDISFQDLVNRFLFAKVAGASGAGLVQQIIARASAIPFTRFVSQQLFEPLEMTGTFYESKSNILFSTGHDLAVFAQMLLNGGIYDHRRYFSPEVVAKFTGSAGLWSKPSDSDWTGEAFSKSAFGHTSDTGPSLWIDPSKHMFIVFLANLKDKSEAGRIQEIIRITDENIDSADEVRRTSSK
jgi:beta-N-acetylhexosaminidase